jgi:hypothetical protein
MTKTVVQIVVFYLLFAMVSTVINIDSQMLSIWINKGSLFFEISILFITLMVLIIVTLFFWDTEYALHLIYNTDFMRYSAGIIGLDIVLHIKCQLDKKYGFVNSSTKTAS